MSIMSQQFLEKMLDFFPTTVKPYEESINRYGEILETIIIEDIFMPEIILCNSEDYQLIDNFSVTVLEKLGEDDNILNIAQKYVRPRTSQLLKETIKNM